MNNATSLRVAASSEERRRAVRAPTDLFVLLSEGGRNHLVQAHDVSLSGMRVAWRRDLPVMVKGEMVSLVFDVLTRNAMDEDEEAFEIKVSAHVARVVEHSVLHTQALGLEFVFLTEEERQHLEAYINDDPMLVVDDTDPELPIWFSLELPLSLEEEGVASIENNDLISLPRFNQPLKEVPNGAVSNASWWPSVALGAGVALTVLGIGAYGLFSDNEDSVSNSTVSSSVRMNVAPSDLETVERADRTPTQRAGAQSQTAIAPVLPAPSNTAAVNEDAVVEPEAGVVIANAQNVVLRATQKASMAYDSVLAAQPAITITSQRAGQRVVWNGQVLCEATPCTIPVQAGPGMLVLGTAQEAAGLVVQKKKAPVKKRKAKKRKKKKRAKKPFPIVD